MFDSLKKKLNVFKKKAEDEFEEEKKKKGGRKKKVKKDLSKLSKEERTRLKKERGWKKVDKKDLLGDVEGGFFSKELSEKKVEDLLWDLEIALLESDVAIPVVDEVKKYLKKELVGKKIKRKFDIGEIIETALRNAITNVLTIGQINFDREVRRSKKPLVLMFVGVNGTGKTTAIAKVAFRLQKMGYSTVLAAGDTFRAGAIEQLTIHSKKLKTKIIKNQPGSDPAAIAYDAVEHAKARKKDVVLIDTAGRMQTNINLMDEMKKVKRISNPDMIIFVGDALAGNDAVIQAEKFEEAVGIDAAILTKIDADAKGGAALSIAKAVGKPIIFVGTGQKYLDLEPFNPEWMVERLFSEA
jgi:fused signal recognition particle receptor